ncbi:MAG: ABC transporter substrate-binding protein [Bacilli bacterium]|jgi:branched-chain amino acid transport system substrate-binding protein
MKKQNKIYLLIGFVVLILIGLVLVLFNKGNNEEEIKIGVIVPLTNSILSQRGVDSSRALSLAVKEVNENGGINGKKISLVVEDNEGKNEESVTILNKLLMKNDTDLFFSLFTGPTSTIYPLIKENSKFLMYQSTVFSMAEDNEALICADYWSFDKLGERFAELAYEEKSNKVGLLRSQTEYGQLFEDSFVKKADELGLNYMIQVFQLSDLDVNTQLTKFKYSGVDLIISDGFEQNYLNLFHGINDLNYAEDLTVVGSSTIYDVSKMDDPIFLSVLNSSKVITAYHDINNSNLVLNDFISEWENEYGSYPTTEAIYSYDDINVLASSLEACDDLGQIKDTKCIYDQLTSKEVEILEGSTYINEDCIFERGLVFLVYDNGEWKDYEK